MKTFICERCGSDDVVKDAYAVWDEKRQEWSLTSVFDAVTCLECGRETTIVEKEI